MKLRKLTTSGIIIAVHITVMYITQSFAFGAVQVRVATALYALGALFPFLPLAFGISNVLSNMLFGGLGPVDIVGGFIIGLATTATVALIKKKGLNDWFLVLPIIFIPGLGVPVYLSQLLNLPYAPLAVSLCIGQVIPAILGVVLVKRLRPLLFNK